MRRVKNALMRDAAHQSARQALTSQESVRRAHFATAAVNSRQRMVRPYRYDDLAAFGSGSKALIGIANRRSRYGARLIQNPKATVMLG